MHFVTKFQMGEATICMTQEMTNLSKVIIKNSHFYISGSLWHCAKTVSCILPHVMTAKTCTKFCVNTWQFGCACYQIIWLLFIGQSKTFLSAVSLDTAYQISCKTFISIKIFLFVGCTVEKFCEICKVWTVGRPMRFGFETPNLPW